jgi:ATP-binding cassette subfamily B (MDR/TAP) protein 1
MTKKKRWIKKKVFELNDFIQVLAIATVILSYFQIAFWIMPAERQSRIIRKNLFISILRQDIGWFDTYKSEELNNRLTE